MMGTGFDDIASLSPEAKRTLLARLLQERVRRPDTFPLSFAQQRLWFLEQWDPQNPLYTLTETIRLGGSLGRSALEHSLQQLVQRHESLRTRFIIVHDQPMQVITPEVDLLLPLIDLSALPEVTRNAELARLNREEKQAPFDLVYGPCASY